jgi:hypothetical protein
MINIIKSTALLFIAVFFLISCSQKQQKTVDSTGGITDTSSFLRRGDTISNLVQKALLANVMQAMKSGGPDFAVTFCNEKAMTLTDSMAKAYNCTIMRVSDKYRNPANKPTEAESDIFANKSMLSNMIPFILVENGKIVYYKPIKIAMPACLKCHGTAGMDIDLKTLEIIKQKYPDDRATNYKEGDFRGLWKITFLSN